MIDQNIKSKIQKLFALANDKGASEDEAATAIRMAAGLMLKHGIGHADLGGEQPKAKKGAKVNARFEKYGVNLANASAYLYGCKVIFYDAGKSGLVFIGRSDNIDAAEQTLTWLTVQLERLYKEALPRGLTQKERSDYRKSFKWACSARVEQRARHLMNDMQRNNSAALAYTGSTALVVSGHFKQLLVESEQMMRAEPGLRSMNLTPKYGAGTDAGRSAGDKVKLRQEIR